MGDRSVSARDISRSVVVIGDGQAASLAFGDTGIRLPLRRKQFPPPDRRRAPHTGEPPRELDLLLPDAGKLPLVGRKDLFEELQAWLDDDTDISVHALIGRAGTGKTRLALEFCRTIDNDPGAKGEWIAGFLSPADLNPVVDTLTTRSFDWERQTLLVVDYAAQCYQALERWFDRLAEQKIETKLRILLLDREAPEGFGWWHELTVLGPPARRDLFYTLRPRQLPDLSDLDDRRALMAAALQAARALRSGASGDTPVPAKNSDRDFDRRLAQTQFGNPLNLVMAGLIALDRGPQAALALRRLDAARQIARRELRRLAELARSHQIDEDEMRHVVAFNGLAGGLPIAYLRETITDELAASHRSTDHLGELLTLLQQELPPLQQELPPLQQELSPLQHELPPLQHELPSIGDAAQQPRLATIQPDLIGEAAIVEALTGPPSREAEAEEAVHRAYKLAPDAAAQALIHLVQDFAYPLEDPNAPDTEKVVGRRAMAWLLNLARQVTDPEQLLPLATALPEKTTVLREPAAELTERLAAHFLRQTERGGDPSAPVNAAVWLNNLASRLTDLGRREEALNAAEQAVGLYRDLAEARPDEFMPDLALSLNNLANSLGGLGRREEALTAAEEAVRHYRALAEMRPDSFISGVARSLNSLANMLGQLGRRGEALKAAEEAVGRYRALAAARPEAFIPDLAGSLNNLASRLSDVGRREEALRAAEEAIGHYRALAEARPDAFIPDLALSLNTLAAMLRDLGRREAALTAAEEAAGHYRALAEARPDAFIPGLAASLNNLSNSLSDLGRREAALKAAEQAVGLRRALAEARPDAFIPNLALSLNNLAIRLSDLGRREEALRAVEEAVGHYRALAEVQPDVFVPDLALSLNNLAIRLSDLGRREESLKAAEEAVGRYRALAAARPEAFIPDLAGSLNNLASRLSDVGRREEALRAAEEAIGHYRALAEARPDAFIPDLALSLNTLAAMLRDLGRRDEALKAAEEAAGHYRALAAARPDAFIPDLARSLNNLATMLGDLGRREAALAAAEAAVGLNRALAAARPEAFDLDFARSLWVLGDLYGETSRSDLAVRTLAEAIQHLMPTFRRVPAAMAEMTAALGQSYLTRCAASGREPDAELLGPMIAVFEEMKQKEEKG